MSPEERQQIRNLIMVAMADTEEQIAELELSTRPISPDKGLGRLTRLEAMQDKAVNEAALSQARARLGYLGEAFGKTEDDGFGLCLSCGRPIPFQRLVAVPEAVCCVHCA